MGNGERKERSSSRWEHAIPCKLKRIRYARARSIASVGFHDVTEEVNILQYQRLSVTTLRSADERRVSTVRTYPPETRIQLWDIIALWGVFYCLLWSYEREKHFFFFIWIPMLVAKSCASMYVYSMYFMFAMVKSAKMKMEIRVVH